MSDSARAAEEGIRSIFGFLEHRAQHTPDGIRWETLDWENQPHYTPTIFLGTGGIPFFFADYHRLTGEARALELAEGALRWCSSPARETERNPEWDWCRNGIMRGRSGLGLAWLSLAAASRDPSHLARAVA